MTLLEEFELHLRATGAECSVPRNIFTARSFLLYCDATNLDPLQITVLDFQKYMLSLRKRNLQNSSINAIIGSLRGFYKFLVISQRVPHSLWEDLQKVKYLRSVIKVKDYMTKEELGDMIEMGETFIEYVNPLKLRALLYFLFYTGLRKKELTTLQRCDIDLDECKVFVRGQTKNYRERVVFFPKRIRATKERKGLDLVEILRDYFKLEPEEQNAFNISGQSLQELIVKLKDFLPKKNLTIHTFRHSFCRMLAREGVDSRIAQKLLGHRSIVTTMIYYDPDVDTVEKTYRDKVR